MLVKVEVATLFAMSHMFIIDGMYIGLQLVFMLIAF